MNYHLRTRNEKWETRTFWSRTWVTGEASFLLELLWRVVNIGKDGSLIRQGSWIGHNCWRKHIRSLFFVCLGFGVWNWAELDTNKNKTWKHGYAFWFSMMGYSLNWSLSLLSLVVLQKPSKNKSFEEILTAMASSMESSRERERFEGANWWSGRRENEN